MAEPVGGWNWVRSTGGRLSSRDRIHLFGQYGLSVGSLPGELLARFGRSGHAPAAVRPAEPPESNIATKARQICQGAGNEHPWLYPHSRRTFQFALLFAQTEQLPFEVDHEILWVAAMLHDIALVDRTVGAESGLRCFAARSASVAVDLAAENDWTGDRQQRLADAIALHINIRVTPRQSVEGHLLNLGSGLDVAGTRSRAIDPTRLRRILEEVPAGDAFGERIWRVWQADAQRSKGCRSRFLKNTGFGLLIKTSPLARQLTKKN